ncbi:hypothetical protein DL96DRAFT_1589559 [Flagelloscypha sp. PMI_526]|nr:hypothetical protein DL96DRAFT_1589559 [Flagelloscypha sp. PMI_526]
MSDDASLAVPTSPEDIEMIGEFGDQIMNDLMSLGVILLAYGAYFVLFIASTRILISRWKESRSSALLLCLSVVLFISQSLRMPTMIYLTALDTKMLLQVPEPILPARFDALVIIGGHASPILHWTRAIAFIVADAIVVWRASMMPNVNRIAALGLTIFMVGNAAMLLVYPMIVSTAKDWVHEHVQIADNIVACAYFISMLTNLAATALIGFSAWKHHITLKGLIGSSGNPQVLKVLITFVETGIFYATLQLMNTAFYFVSSFNPPDFTTTPDFYKAAQIVDEITIAFAAISPVIVILVVQGGRSPLSNVAPSSVRPQPPTSYNLSSTAKERSTSNFGGTTKRDSFGLASSNGSLKDVEKAI